MTVKELSEILNKYPDNMNVQVTYTCHVRDIDKVSTTVDINTNIISVNIIAKNNY